MMKAETYTMLFPVHGLGNRMVTIVTMNLDNFSGAGMAICSPEDPFNKNLGRDIAMARAFKSLSEHMDRETRRFVARVGREVKHGKELARELAEKDKERAQEERADRLIKSHEERLARAVQGGRLVKCSACLKWFGFEDNLHPYNEGVHRICPYCGAVTAAPSRSHPTAKTGAPGGEPGPSVPTGTEGKAVNPQGDDGQARPGGIDFQKLQKAIDSLPPSGGIIDGETPRVDDGQAPPKLPNICLTCSRTCKKDNYYCMDYAKAPICAACGGPIMDGDQYYSMGPKVGKIYHHPRCTPDELMVPVSTPPPKEPAVETAGPPMCRVCGEPATRQPDGTYLTCFHTPPKE